MVLSLSRKYESGLWGNASFGLWGPAAPLGPVVAPLVPRCALLPAPTPRRGRASRVWLMLVRESAATRRRPAALARTYHPATYRPRASPLKFARSASSCGG